MEVQKDDFVLLFDVTCLILAPDADKHRAPKTEEDFIDSSGILDLGMIVNVSRRSSNCWFTSLFLP